MLVGFDLAAGFPGKDQGIPFKAMTGALLLAGLVFSCWGWVSAEYVSSSRLADTSIPHIKVARAVLGDKGLILMGIIVLSGASGAVNALLIAVSRMMAAMAGDGLLPSFFALGKKNPVAGILVLGAGIAALMGSGMAGEPVLEVYIKAGLCFWLIHYAVLHGAALVTSVRALTESSAPPGRSMRPLPMAGLIAMMLTLTGIFITEEDWQLLVRIVAALAFLGFALSVSWVFFSRKKGRLHKIHAQ
jgi:amino acid transporter